MKMRLLAALTSAAPALGFAQSPCPLWQVNTPGLEIAIDFKGTRLPRASLVQQTEEKICPEGSLPVQVRSVHHWYQEKGRAHTEIGTHGCIERQWLVPVEGKQLVGIGPPVEGSVHQSGLRLGEYTRSRLGVPTCGAIDVPMRPGMEPLPVSELAHTRAVDRSQIALILAMGGRELGAEGQGDAPIQVFSDWGFVSMPVAKEISAEELEQIYEDEGLQTTKQREKSTIAIGAWNADGDVIYTRFLGSDARRSDRWGTPHTVRVLVGLARDWFRYCTEELPTSTRTASPKTCPVQFGDLAWYNSKMPDPLGHTTHQQGTCVDIRLFRSDGSRYEAYWNRADDRPGHATAYDQDLTKAFLRFANENIDISRLYFNDPVIIAATPGLEARKGHDDHIHLCVTPLSAGD